MKPVSTWLEKEKTVVVSEINEQLKGVGVSSEHEFLAQNFHYTVLYH